MHMLTFWGHNCFSYESKKSIFITDPWFSTDGGFLGTWHQYPDNSHLALRLIDKVKQSDKNVYIYVSHEHSDHFDREFLAMLPKGINYILPKFSDNFLFREISSEIAVGCSVIQLSNAQTLNIDSHTKATIYISEVGINRDSAIAIDIDGDVFFNQNDCKIFDLISNLEFKIKYYSCQFSGANYHPCCYTYSDEKMKRISIDKVESKLHTLCQTLKTLQPEFYLPSAGPAIFPFLPDNHPARSIDSTFIHQDYLGKYLAKEGIKNAIYLSPGDKFSHLHTTPIPAPTQDTITKYRESRKDLWQQLENGFSVEKFKDVIVHKLAQIKDVDIEGQPLIVFKWGEDAANDAISLDINRKELFDGDQSVDKSLFHGVYLVEAEPKFFGQLCLTERWQDVFLSLRQSVHRSPDKFSNIVNLFLYSDGSIRETFESTRGIPDDKFLLALNHEKYECRKYCPHQGADLSKARIIKGRYIVCPRHGWKFDLDDGGINVESGLTLEAKVIEGASSDSASQC